MTSGRVLLASACLYLLVASLDLRFGQEATGEVPFFNDEGDLSLPEDSAEQLEESMPELKLFGSRGHASTAPPLPRL